MLMWRLIKEPLRMYSTILSIAHDLNENWYGLKIKK